MTPTFNHLQQETLSRIDRLFVSLLKNTPAPLLQEAIHYVLFNSGKRLRPLLVYAAGASLHAPSEALDAAAGAIELIHCYSLVHDDLPAMDNSDLRRGKPTCHKVYGDAIAILVGDTLQTLAFELLATHPTATLDDKSRLQMIRVLAKACGVNGITSGQTLDITGVKEFDQIKAMYELKTAVLLKACVELACVAANIKDKTVLEAFITYAECIGMAYQIQDDLLEIENDSVSIGKPKGLDIVNHKVTYVSLSGVEDSKKEVNRLFSKALSALETIDINQAYLIKFAEYVLKRKM